MTLRKTLLLLLATATIFSGCTTTGTFKVPAGTKLSIYERPAVDVPADGKVSTKPFFWTATGVAPHGGAPYALIRNGQVVKRGKLRVKFRPVSIFWPPFALIYWPMGLNPDITYDLVHDKQM
ncbi:MAG: hypothetical protein KDD62_12590 [Bdellovibrionales bacterium]|nr:hypothetical protein [Bdellovibrionales bacterium]